MGEILLRHFLVIEVEVVVVVVVVAVGRVAGDHSVHGRGRLFLIGQKLLFLLLVLIILTIAVKQGRDCLQRTGLVGRLEYGLLYRQGFR